MQKRLLALLFILLNNFCISQTNQKSVSEIKLLRVGDKAPSISAFKWLKGVPVTNFKKGQVYVVEFGATWCTPCAAAIPHLTQLAKKHGPKVNVIGLFVMELNNDLKETKNPEYVKKVEQYVKKQGEKMVYNVGVDDPGKTTEHAWLKAAGKTGIPYTFVVDKNGMIAWIGVGTDMLDNVVETVNSDSYDLAKAVKWSREQEHLKTPYDQKKLLLIEGNGGSDTDFLFRSVLTKSKGTFQSGHFVYINSYDYAQKGTVYEGHIPFKGRVQEVNAWLSHLYYMAYGDTLYNQVPVRFEGLYPDTIKISQFKRSYGKYWYEPILEVKDSTPFKWSHKSPENTYHYSLKVPLEKATAKFMQEAMQRDLKTYFGYDVRVETRMMPYWKLSATPRAESILKAKTLGGMFNLTETDERSVFTNAEMKDIIAMLGTFYGYGDLNHGNLPLASQAPFIDETGISYKIDFVMEAIYRTDFVAFKKYLQSVGLILEKSKKEMKVVVIRDPK